MNSFHLTDTGFRELNFTIGSNLIQELRDELLEFRVSIPPYLNSFSGKGIVLCAGGITYFTCAWILIKNLRRIGCDLPIELWYYEGELTEDLIFELQKFNVRCQDFRDFGYSEISGYMMKPIAILESSFKEVLFLDADNNCISDPSYLFDFDEYKQHGTIFWPDFWKTSSTNPIWQIVNSHQYDTYEQESGQIVINKEKCWEPLNVCCYLNRNNDIYYKLLWGDKDTFKFAWLFCRSSYYMIGIPAAICGYIDKGEFLGITIVQYDFNEKILFLHRNLLKWDESFNVGRKWYLIKSFAHNATTRKIHFSYRSDDHPYLNFLGDVDEELFEEHFENFEDINLGYLDELKAQGFYDKFINGIRRINE
jgi:alpha 1,2-mannosyltransferase